MVPVSSLYIHPSVLLLYCLIRFSLSVLLPPLQYLYRYNIGSKLPTQTYLVDCKTARQHTRIEMIEIVFHLPGNETKRTSFNSIVKNQFFLFDKQSIIYQTFVDTHNSSEKKNKRSIRIFVFCSVSIQCCHHPL